MIHGRLKINNGKALEFFANATEPHSSDGFMFADSCWENELYVKCKCKHSMPNMLFYYS